MTDKTTDPSLDRTFDPAFKLQVARMVREQGVSVSQVGRISNIASPDLPCQRYTPLFSRLSS
ncbi:hypothetical protein, partial [Klebsiella pneumoniae]|uniref:hypothetical protein n=1 Tax=Klebsiella pneumoniae TaxID=573 RepID=UPI0012FF091C